MSRISLHQAPTFSHILVAIGATLFTAGVIHGSLLSRGVKTFDRTEKWQNATKEYMKQNKMNPIFGISKGL